MKSLGINLKFPSVLTLLSIFTLTGCSIAKKDVVGTFFTADEHPEVAFKLEANNRFSMYTAQKIPALGN